MQNIVFIVRYFYPIKRISGISSFVYELCCRIASRFDLTVISYQYHNEGKLTESHRGFRILKVGNPFYFTSARLAAKLKPDKVIFFSGVRQDIWLLPLALVKILFMSKLKVFFCQCVHFTQIKALPIKLRVLDAYQGTIALHPNIKDMLKKYSSRSAELISPGIEFERLDRIEPVIKQAEIRIGFFGHFHKNKGADILLDLFLELDKKNTELILAGQKGELYEPIAKRIRDSDNIRLLGYEKDILSWIASCDIVVLPYLTSRAVLGIAQTAIEAMYFKVCVIGSNTECLNNLIEDEVNGFLFTSMLELKTKLRSLIVDGELRKRIGNQARMTIVKHYSIEQAEFEFVKALGHDK